MLKYFLGFILFLVSGPVDAQLNSTTTIVRWQKSVGSNGGDTILYDQYKKLVWSDFRGDPDKKSVAAAITESGFGYRLAVQSRNGKTDIIITVVCFFNKNKSWVKPHLKSEYALTHEQHHFDLTYIAACLFFQKLKSTQFTLDNCSSLVDKINDECYAELGRMQDAYDGQTKNGLLKQVQFAWNKKIDDQLASLITN